MRRTNYDFRRYYFLSGMRRLTAAMVLAMFMVSGVCRFVPFSIGLYMQNQNHMLAPLVTINQTAFQDTVEIFGMSIPPFNNSYENGWLSATLPDDMFLTGIREEIGDIIRSLVTDGRRDPEVTTLPGINIERFAAAELLGEEEAEQLRDMAGELVGQFKSGRKRKFLKINATEFGGGVAEFNGDIISLLHDLQIPGAKWLVMDGIKSFYDATVHIHEALHSGADYPPLNLRQIELLQLVWIHNFLRMVDMNLIGEETECVWIDDPQPIGLLPLIKAFFPHIKVIWRCHVDTSQPHPQVAAYLRSILSGKLSERITFGEKKENVLNHNVLFKFIFSNLKRLGLEDELGQKRLFPENLKADAAVFHMEEFAAGMELEQEGIDMFFMPPPINPLSLKMVPLTENFLRMTAKKYQLMEETEALPPVVGIIARFDPMKGPLEAITAFISGLLNLDERRDDEREYKKRSRMFYASNAAGDNPKSKLLLKLMLAFRDALPAEWGDENLEGENDIRKRIHIIELEDKRIEEKLLELIHKYQNSHSGDSHKYSGPGIALLELIDLKRRFLEENKLEIIGESGFRFAEFVLGALYAKQTINKEVMENILKNERDFLAKGIEFSAETRDELVMLMTGLNYPKDMIQRAANDELTGKEMNALEVNALQTLSMIRMQTSSKEGFGLTVAEASGKESIENRVAGIMVAFAVGGITMQIVTGNENDRTGKLVPYHAEDIQVSLEMYITVDKMIEEYKRITGKKNLTDEDYEELFDFRPQGELSHEKEKWKGFLEEKFKEIQQRVSIKLFALNIADSFRMEPERRLEINMRAREFILQEFATVAYVRKLINVLLKVMPKEPAINNPHSPLSPGNSFLGTKFIAPIEQAI